ncbi:hypothetical protein [Streptomyces halobius]|uniref:Uncharacterized protein n=1 Tax=Streptomyces halobius TaxID=2879846 RepID=A0ABY4MIT8_9ACTN|nr:hypothetical protein [Streptomyces halobius]UQA96296.1 hypothetical protein K9S39_34425 [Streptomyces halobius]
MYDSDESGAAEFDSGFCDLCGAPLSPTSQMFSLVPDSSVIHPDDPDQDGQRLLAACTPEHLGELRERHRQRPYVKEELWAGKIDRALRAHPEGLDEEQLAEATGLNFIQIEHTLSWESERFLRRQASLGDVDTPLGDLEGPEGDAGADGDDSPGDSD